jgi:dienelactone hydrolase/protein required for attachment to host cells
MTTATQPSMTRPVLIHAETATINGDLTLPGGAASGLVLFAHGSGSSRHSPRNRFVAEELNNAGFATLLIDLLTHEEEQTDLSTGKLRFNVRLLTDRLVAATDWASEQPDLRELPIGYFGASTGAAAALVAAAERPESTGAVVSRGGRPDLAGDSLGLVYAPTLLIVGGDDAQVIALNDDALRRLRCERKMMIVPHATHLFEEPSALRQVATLAAEWFQRHLPPLVRNLPEGVDPPAAHPQYLPPPRRHSARPWIVVADASRAFVLTPRDRQHLDLVQELSYPAGRAHAREFTPDRPGRIGTSTSHSAVSAMDRHTPPKQVEAETFARRLAHALDQARNAHAFDALALVAPPRFLGLLRKSLSPAVRRVVIASAHKELTWMQPHELDEPLKDLIAALPHPHAS